MLQCWKNPVLGSALTQADDTWACHLSSCAPVASNPKIRTLVSTFCSYFSVCGHGFLVLLRHSVAGREVSCPTSSLVGLRCCRAELWLSWEATLLPPKALKMSHGTSVAQGTVLRYVGLSD